MINHKVENQVGTPSTKSAEPNRQCCRVAYLTKEIFSNVTWFLVHFDGLT